jgi:hypothetical protein
VFGESDHDAGTSSDMKGRPRHAVDAILQRRSLSPSDFEEVAQLRDDGFDYLKEAADRAQAPRSKTNALRLMAHVGHRISERSGTHRLAEVLAQAVKLLNDPESDVRVVAARTITGVVGLLNMMSGEAGGGEVMTELRRRLPSEPDDVVRSWLHKAIVAIESASNSRSLGDLPE